MLAGYEDSELWTPEKAVLTITPPSYFVANQEYFFLKVFRRIEGAVPGVT